MIGDHPPTTDPLLSLYTLSPVLAAAPGAAYGVVTADEEDSEEDLAPMRELAVADYVVFLLALGTYIRYLDEQGVETDDVLKKGMMLMRRADTASLDPIAQYIKSNLVNKSQIAMLEASLRTTPTPRGAAVRALKFRTILQRGGTSTTKAIFGKSIKARKEVLDALEAVREDDPDVALAKLDAIILRQKLLATWIDEASASAKPRDGAVNLNPVQAASKGVPEATNAILAAQVTKTAQPGTEAGQQAQEANQAALGRVQMEAQEAAAKAMEKTGEVDQPVTKAQAIGIATATVAQALGDPDNDRNLPPALRGLDPEQAVVATTDGRVLVAAAAGSGKTHTLTARAQYLIEERGMNPSRMLITCFNTGAAAELRERLAGRMGPVAADMHVGTMHSLFASYIRDYGTAEEKDAIGRWFMGGAPKPGAMRSAPSEAVLASAMARVWKECKESDAPTGTGILLQSWLMNDITPDAAAKTDVGRQNPDTVEWYRWWLGFKGVDKKWAPPCPNKPNAQKQWTRFLTSYRNNGNARLGDFSDMIVIFRDILKRDPLVRKKIQSQLDFVAADEAQDLNLVQHEIFLMLTEHIQEGSGKSAMLIGDEVQCVNTHVGARPELFTAYAQDPAWKVLTIGTNYRCLPEIVETAQKMMGTHPRGIPMEAHPDASKPRGVASIVVKNPTDNTEGAILVVDQISQAHANGEPLSDNAVLTRTNKELNDFETACIINHIPYGRKGSTSFLQARETQVVMSYMHLVLSQDFAKMQDALAYVFNTPNRFFLSGADTQRVVRGAVERRAQEMGVSTAQVNPLTLFDRKGIETFINLINNGPGPAWKTDAQREQLQRMGYDLQGLKRTIDKGTVKDIEGKEVKYSTTQLIGDILSLKGVADKSGDPEPSLADTLMPTKVTDEEIADDPDVLERQKESPLGNVAFLYQLAKAPPDKTTGDPSDPKNFKTFLEGMAASAKDLRVDLEKHRVEQSKLAPEDRKPADCVVLSTIHRVKGAQWKNVAMVMADGTFPRKEASEAYKLKKMDAPLDAGQQKALKDFYTERQVAYVGVTRAKANLVILCPNRASTGKIAGTPIFVEEAGLHQGQNVPGKGDPMPDHVPAEMLKEASAEDTQASVFVEPLAEPDTGVDFEGLKLFT